MAGQNLDVGAIINVAEPIALDLIAWLRGRQDEGKSLPTDEEVIARAKGKAQAIIDEGTAALNEFPDPSTAPSATPLNAPTTT